MPMYDFLCENDHKFERMVKLADFELLQHCACTSPATRVISTPMLSTGNVDYDCPITGKRISSQRAHRENLRKHSCRVLEPGETAAAERFRTEEDAKFEKALDDSVERSIEAMPSEKKEKLANELLAGSDIQVTRN